VREAEKEGRGRLFLSLSCQELLDTVGRKKKPQSFLSTRSSAEKIREGSLGRTAGA